MLDADAIPTLVALLAVDDSLVQMWASIALANITWQGNAAVVEAVVDMDALPKLVALLAIDQPQVQTQAARAAVSIEIGRAHV